MKHEKFKIILKEEGYGKVLETLPMYSISEVYHVADLLRKSLSKDLNFDIGIYKVTTYISRSKEEKCMCWACRKEKDKDDEFLEI